MSCYLTDTKRTGTGSVISRVYLVSTNGFVTGSLTDFSLIFVIFLRIIKNTAHSTKAILRN